MGIDTQRECTSVGGTAKIGG